VRNITKPRFQCIIKKYFGQFWAKIGKIGQKFVGQKLAKNVFIMQSGYWEQTLFYKIFSFIIEKILYVQ